MRMFTSSFTSGIPGPFHHAASSELGWGTAPYINESTSNWFLDNPRIGIGLVAGRDMRASWSASFLPGSVKPTLASSRFDRLARFTASMIWISALKIAYTEGLYESWSFYRMITEPGL